MRDALIALDSLWDELFPAEQARIVALPVDRVDIGLDGLAVRLRVDGFPGVARNGAEGGAGGMNNVNTVTVKVPIAIKRRRGTKRVVTLARTETINPSYVSRTLHLALLSPSLVEAILDGRRPEGMTLKRLMQRPVPADWKHESRG